MPVDQVPNAPVRFQPEMEHVSPDEAGLHAELSRTLTEISETTLKHSGHATRGVHAKSHGVLRGYVRVPYRTVLLTRRNLLRRDAHTCQYCGAAERLTLDHVLPRSRGGTDAWDNLVAACTRCNSRKGNRTPEEAGMPLARAPFRPSHVMYMRDFLGETEEAWKPYLFVA